MFSTAPMDRLDYLGYSNDADVDALLSQLSDENLLKLKMNTHNTSSRGFEYPTFTDGWMEDDPTGALDTQLTSRFSTLKRPIAPVKKKGTDSLKVGKNVFNLDGGLGAKKESRDYPTVVGKKSTDSPAVVGKKSRDSRSLDRKARDSDVVGWKGGEDEAESRRLSSKSSSRTSSRSREDGSSTRRHPMSKDASRSSSRRTEFRSFKFSDDSGSAAGADDDDEDPDSLDALLNERFRALKAPSPPLLPPTSSAPSTRNLGLDNIIRISGQLSSNDYDSYGSSMSSPSSPSANLLGRSKRRSSPRVMTTSVATSCHCSAPSALKLLKQVGSKSFPSRQQLSPGSLPPLSPAPRSSPPVKKSSPPVQKPSPPVKKPSPPVKKPSLPVKKAARDYKVEGFGNSKPATKESEKNVKEKRDKNERKSSNEESNVNNPTTVKDMRRLLSSVADRVGLERSRVSSAVDDESLDEDLSVWSSMEGDQEFARASTEEEKLNREAERVVEWAKDAARLGTGESDVDIDADDLELNGEDDDEDSERKHSKKEKPKKGFKVGPKKKKWGLF